MNNLCTLSKALEFSNKNNLEEWIHLFLNAEGNNVPFSDGLKLEKRYFVGPLKMPLNLFSRCCGPEKNMKYVVNELSFKNNVYNIVEMFKNNWDMPPLIINYSKGKFELNDGNHRYEALVQNKTLEYYIIIWITEKEDFEDFIIKYNEFL